MEELTALEYAKLCADAVMASFSPSELPPSHRFHYHQGVFLTGVEKIYKLTGDKKYRAYIKDWVDAHVKDDGSCPTAHLTEFDDIQPGVLLFGLFDSTVRLKYKLMLDTLFDRVEKWPTNAKGGVWHKYSNKNQMWLDTMYMMGMFAASYAAKFQKPYIFEKILYQAVLMRENMTDPENGLMYHMWDDSKQHRFADKKSGLVTVHWGRAVGWYVTALAEFTYLAPKGSGLFEFSARTARELLDVLRGYQDESNGMWYQVLDKPEDERNWHETSCTSLITYAAALLYNNGLIGDEYKEMIISGYRGALSKTEITDKGLSVTGVCVGTGVGPERYYFERPTVANDLHGAGAFIMMCTEIEKLMR